MRVLVGLSFVTGVLVTPAQAALSTTTTLASEYQLSAVSISARRPVLQQSLDWSGASGWYFGTWASSGVDFGGCCRESWELDLYAGRSLALGPDISLDLSLSDYRYPGSRGLGYTELGVELRAAGGWQLRLNWSEDFLGSGSDGFYLEGRYERALGAGWTGVFHAGRTGGPAFSAVHGLFPPYSDVWLGVQRALGAWRAELLWVDTSLDGAERIERGVLSNQSRLVLSLSRTWELD